MPSRRLPLLLPDIGRYPLILGFGQQNPVPRRDVFILQVAVAGACLRWNGKDVPDRPELRAFAGRMQAGNLICPNLADFAPCVQPAIDEKGMAVAQCIARPKLDEVLTASLVSLPSGVPGCRPADRAGRPWVGRDSLIAGLGRRQVAILLGTGRSKPERLSSKKDEFLAYLYIEGVGRPLHRPVKIPIKYGFSAQANQLLTAVIGLQYVYNVAGVECLDYYPDGMKDWHR